MVVVEASGLAVALVVSEREGWAGRPRQQVSDFAPPMRPCLIAYALLQACGCSAMLRFLKAERWCRPGFFATVLSALIPYGVAEKNGSSTLCR